MTAQAKTVIKATAVGGLLVAAVALGLSRLHHVTAVGEEGLRVWFYDESEQRLYAAPRDALPPHAGIGGTRDDGVRAVVVAAPNEQGDAGKRRIAYLETYTPELKRILEDMRTARATGRPSSSPLPAGDSDFLPKNTLVRRPGEATWYDQTSAAGQRIMTEWRSWTSADGQPLVVCVP